MGCGGSKGAVKTSDARLREAITDMERRAEEEEAAALVRFANSAWTTDSVESLKTLLSTPVGLASFEAYLKTEYSVRGERGARPDGAGGHDSLA